jgi:hypothetical protein
VVHANDQSFFLSYLMSANGSFLELTGAVLHNWEQTFTAPSIPR